MAINTEQAPEDNSHYINTVIESFQSEEDAKSLLKIHQIQSETRRLRQEHSDALNRTLTGLKERARILKNEMAQYQQNLSKHSQTTQARVSEYSKCITDAQMESHRLEMEISQLEDELLKLEQGLKIEKANLLNSQNEPDDIHSIERFSLRLSLYKGLGFNILNDGTNYQKKCRVLSSTHNDVETVPLSQTDASEFEITNRLWELSA